jgi:SET domain-containing protein
MKSTSKQASPPCKVKLSPVHGNGVFATRKIEAGECIIEYTGERIDWPEALRRAEASAGPVNHTFFFSLADGNVIDGGSQGNDARWINHACEPNCEAYEDEGKVFIHSLMEIEKGEELNYNYALVYEARHTAAVKKSFECRCGTPGCLGTMLAPKKRKSRAQATA